MVSTEIIGQKLIVPTTLFVELTELLKKLNAEQMTIINSKLYVPANVVTVYADLSSVIQKLGKETTENVNTLSVAIPGYADLSVFAATEEPVIEVTLLDEDTIEFYAKPVKVTQRLGFFDEDIYREEMQQMLSTETLFRYTINEAFYKIYSKLATTGVQVILTPNAANIYKHKTDVISVESISLSVIKPDKTDDKTVINVPENLIKLKPNSIDVRKLDDETYMYVLTIPIQGLNVYVFSLTDSKPVATNQIEELLQD